MPIVRTSSRFIVTIVGAVFLLAAVVGCNAPQASSTPSSEAGTDTGEAVLQAYRQYGGEVVELGATTPTATADVTNVTGTTPAYALTQGDPPCAGYVQNLPSLVFTLTTEEQAIQVDFAGNTTTTLIAVAEGEEIICDENAPLTRTPQLVLTQPKAGRYGIWIGRTDMQEPINGRLTVSLTSK